MESKTCTASDQQNPSIKDTNANPSDAQKAFNRLSEVLDTLRRECPWDRAQTLQTLRYLTIEEVHELSDAIIEKNSDALRKELGDLAMHILFYCKLAEDKGLFSTADVYNGVCDKLVERHPFIYRKDDYHGESWEQLKMRESDHKGVLDGVPHALPSMVKAVRIQEKVAGRLTGKPNGEMGIPNIVEVPEGTSAKELGDMIFGLVDWARRNGINADDALCQANNAFCQAYKH